MLFKGLKFLSVAFLCVIVFGMTSCSESEETVIDSSDFTEQTVNEYRGGDRDTKGCFDLVYPITIQFADDTTAEVTDRANLKETVKAWFETTGTEKTRDNKPTIVFPVSVDADGETIEIASEAEFDELKDMCIDEHRGHGKKGKGRGHHGDDCEDVVFEEDFPFEIVFPVSFELSGETVTFNSEEELYEGLEAYLEANGEDAEIPMPIFPVTFIDADTGEEFVINSEEELDEILDDLFGEFDYDEDYDHGYGKGHGKGHGKGKHHDGKRCYERVFPITYNVGGEEVTFESREELRDAFKAYKEENGKDAERPELVFPATFSHRETGEETVVNSLEELETLKSSCE